MKSASFLFLSALLWCGCNSSRPAQRAKHSSLSDACAISTKLQKAELRSARGETQRHQAKKIVAKKTSPQRNQADKALPRQQFEITDKALAINPHKASESDTLLRPFIYPIEIKPSEKRKLNQTKTSIVAGTLNPSVKQRNNSKAIVFISEAKRKIKQSAQSLFVLGFAGLTAMGLMRMKEKKLIRLSRWAKEHPYLARSVITAAHSTVGVGGLMLGSDLYSNGFIIPSWAQLTSLGIFTTATAFYPTAYADVNIPSFSYLRRKFHDTALFTAGAMMTVSVGNNYSLEKQPYNATSYTFSVPVPATNERYSIVKNDFAKIKASDEPKVKSKGNGGKIAGTVAICLLFTLLALVVAGISCEIYCAGSGGLAALVLLGGVGLCVYGAVASVRSIWGLKKKKTQAAITK